MRHESVLLAESIEAMNLQSDSVVVDATLGLGGHSLAILSKIKSGFLYAFEIDKDAKKNAQKKLKNYSNYEIIETNFVNIKKELKKRQVEAVDVIFFDLGVSSLQLDCGKRGFSFHQDALLDMRMNQSQSLTAYDIVNNYSESNLANIFFQYGEEKYARKVAQEIVSARSERPIKTTMELVAIIQNSVPQKYRRQTHPARRIFQALRIEVNNELANFEQALKDSLDLLAINGRLVVITFHSLEDRICQKVFKSVAKLKPEIKKLPIVPDNLKLKYKILKKIKPSAEEIKQNPRARSATLRILERVR